jgi:hypothetical protein
MGPTITLRVARPTDKLPAIAAMYARWLGDAGFRMVPSFNPYWAMPGRTFEDANGYRVVLQNPAWATSTHVVLAETTKQ